MIEPVELCPMCGINIHPQTKFISTKVHNNFCSSWSNLRKLKEKNETT